MLSQEPKTAPTRERTAKVATLAPTPRHGALNAAAGLVRARFALLLTLVVVAVFGAFCFYHYRLPGLYYDEAFDAVPAMQMLQGQPVSLLRGVGIHLFGHTFPVMIGDYWGVVSTYAVLPLFWLFGVGVFPLRLWPIAAGMAAIVLTAALGRRLYGQAAGLLAASMLAVFPSFIFWSRIGIYVISHIVAVSLGIMLAYLVWRERGARRYLFLSALLTGVGLSTKLLFLWFLIAIPAAYVALLIADALSDGVARRGRGPGRGLLRASWQRFRADVPLHSLADPIVAGLGFLVGAFPVLYYNLISRGSYLVLRANLFQTERGVDNFAIWSNLKIEADSVRVLLNGGYFWFYGGIYQNRLYPWVAALSVAALLLLVHRVDALRIYRRSTVFLLAFAAAIFVLSCFTVSILGATHLLILLPIPQLMIAACAIHGARWLAQRLPGRSVWPRWLPWLTVTLLLAALLARDVWVDTRYHQALARSGGVAAFSNGIYTLAGQLDRLGVRRPYALDWGMKNNVMILTQGRVEPLEIYGATFEPGPDFEGAVRAALTEPDPIFIALSEESAAYPRLDAFRRLVAESGRDLIVVQTITERSGRPVYYIFRVH